VEARWWSCIVGGRKMGGTPKMLEERVGLGGVADSVVAAE